MDASAWDTRYSSADLVWSSEPNVFVSRFAETLEPGACLDLAAGEGRNSIWLAQRGWSVRAVDFSPVALERASAIAKAQLGERAQKFQTEVADLLAWQPDRAYDLVIVAYVHLPHAVMHDVLARASSALAEGGHMLVVGHALANLKHGQGGPQDPEVLYTSRDVLRWTCAAGVDMEVVESGEVQRGDAIDALAFVRRVGVRD